MRVKDIHFSKRISLGPYNRLSLEFGASADLDPGETVEAAQEQLSAVVQSELNKQIDRAHEELQAVS